METGWKSNNRKTKIVVAGYDDGRINESAERRGPTTKEVTTM